MLTALLNIRIFRIDLRMVFGVQRNVFDEVFFIEVANAQAVIDIVRAVGNRIGNIDELRFKTRLLALQQTFA